MSTIDFRTVPRQPDQLRGEDLAQHQGEQMEQSEARHAAQIHELFGRGFAGEAVCLPDAYLSVLRGAWIWRENYTHFAHAVQDATDHDQVLKVLLQACRARKEGRDADLGPLLDTFMSACADAYSAEHASDLAKAERDMAEDEAKESR